MSYSCLTSDCSDSKELFDSVIVSFATSSPPADILQTFALQILTIPGLTRETGSIKDLPVPNTFHASLMTAIAALPHPASLCLLLSYYKPIYVTQIMGSLCSASEQEDRIPPGGPVPHEKLWDLLKLWPLRTRHCRFENGRNNGEWRRIRFDCDTFREWWCWSELSRQFSGQ